MKQNKAKITYSKVNLSALVIANLAKAIKSDVPLIKNAKPLAADKSEIYNVELKLDNQSFFGELTIISYLISHANSALPTAQKYLN
jgi:hypothetical protein